MPFTIWLILTHSSSSPPIYKGWSNSFPFSNSLSILLFHLIPSFLVDTIFFTQVVLMTFTGSTMAKLCDLEHTHDPPHVRVHRGLLISFNGNQNWFQHLQTCLHYCESLLLHSSSNIKQRSLHIFLSPCMSLLYPTSLYTSLKPLFFSANICYLYLAKLRSMSPNKACCRLHTLHNIMLQTGTVFILIRCSRVFFLFHYPISLHVCIPDV